ncbi:MAG: TetR family transcriptional regulator, partial [Nocardioidaceae bacterium]|nr:TetR family transcriptional regulator [Nocardioidaceae bacterium]
LESVLSEMGKEDLELERLRNELIGSVPELSRGVISEMVRPMRLYAAALATRLGREPDDPDLLMFAGAAIGGMVIGGGLDEARETPAAGDLMKDALSRFERLESMLTLPVER